MRILKHQWVAHGADLQIFSVDIHPKGTKFVTGGQGVQSGRIIIWNFAPLLNKEDEVNPNVPKILCQIDSHMSCVNIVRWSCDGQFLASGDDKLVMVWKLSEEPGSSLLGKKKNVESWKSVARLMDHTGDIFDLAWAPNDGFLATASVDNTVIVWNARRFPDKVATLKDHIDMVKGVAWDPLGQYLATQSADRTLRIWRTADWSQEEVVSDCFADCTATTHVLRLSWSPEGQYLVSAHAMNGGGPTAQIIERNGWKQERDLVGHKKAVTCVRFNSNIFKREASSEKYEPYCCCALGSRDCSLSVWHTSLQRPLINIKNLFRESILDIAWSSNGLHLIACSLDGTIALLDFTSEEMGIPLSSEEKSSMFEQMYGQSLQQSWNKHLIEQPALERKMEVDCIGSEMKTPVMKQRESVSVTGRKKITPVNLNPFVPPSALHQIACSSTITGTDPIVRSIHGDNVKVKVTNAFQVSLELCLAKIEGFINLNNHQSTTTWETYLRSSVKCIAVNEKMIVACCEDFTVNCLLVSSGSRVLPPMVLEDLVISLTFNSNSVCLVLTKSGFIHMWNFETGTSILIRLSLQTLLSNDASVKECGLSENGSPIVTLADGRVYSYSFAFKTWMESSNPSDLFNQIVESGMTQVPPGVQLSILESKLFGSTPEEYKYWLMATVNHLIENGPECRLRSILDGFIGPYVFSENREHDNDAKRLLFTEILDVLKTKLQWQFLYLEYEKRTPSPVV